MHPQSTLQIKYQGTVAKIPAQSIAKFGSHPIGSQPIQQGLPAPAADSDPNKKTLYPVQIPAHSQDTVILKVPTAAHDESVATENKFINPIIRKLSGRDLAIPK